MTSGIPSRADFMPREWRLIQRLNTPSRVQRWLNRLRYNTEAKGGTQRSFRSVLRVGSAHCMEAALFAAVVLEQHGYPPVVMSIESKDWLDHVVFLYTTRGRWGTIARSRDPGLHGRKPVFRSPRDVALSYVEGYVDYTGRVRGYGVCNLAEALPHYDWRFSLKNLWRVEQLLIDWPHKKIKTSDRRYRALLKRYIAYRKKHGKKPWRYYRGREKWTPLPAEFR
jgi:hypothetical protein